MFKLEFLRYSLWNTYLKFFIIVYLGTWFVYVSFFSRVMMGLHPSLVQRSIALLIAPSDVDSGSEVVLAADHRIFRRVFVDLFLCNYSSFTSRV